MCGVNKLLACKRPVYIMCVCSLFSLSFITCTSQLPGLRVKDPEFGSAFWSAVESLEFLSTMGRIQAWKTKKEVLDRYGEEEFETLIQDGSLLVRPNPLNPKLKLYLDRSDSMQLNLKKITKYSATATTKLNKDQFTKLQDAFQKDLDDDMMDKMQMGTLGDEQ